MSESKFEDTSFGEDDFDLGGEETFMETSGTAEEIRFDEAVGALEDILVCDDEFRSIQDMSINGKVKNSRLFTAFYILGTRLIDNLKA